MHVYYSPRGQDRLLVGIAECVEDGGYALYAVLNSQIVGGTSHRAYALTCLTEDVCLIVFAELAEHLLGYSLWHELRP